MKGYLISSGGASIYDIAEHFDVSSRTALRQIQALEAAREPLYEEMVGRRKVWRLRPGEPPRPFMLTETQMIALTLCRGLFDFLAGTGLVEDLRDLFARLDRTLGYKGHRAQDMRRKFLIMDEPAPSFDGIADTLNDVLSALVKEQQLRFRHAAIERGQLLAMFDPYTLVLYKKALYLVGFSHYYSKVLRLGVDKIRDVEWVKGSKFEYPVAYDPQEHVGGAFGLVPEEPTTVRIFFKQKVARLVRRRVWDPTQKIRDVEGGVELTMQPRSTKELISWVLRWGAQAEVLAPESLRRELAADAMELARIYGGAPPAEQLQLIDA